MLGSLTSGHPKYAEINRPQRIRRFFSLTSFILLFVALLPFRRPIDAFLYSFSPILGLGWKEGVICLLFLASIPIWVTLKGWRLWFFFYFITIFLYGLFSFDLYAIGFRWAYFTSGPLFFILITTFVRDKEHAAKGLRLLFWALALYTVGSAFMLLFSEIEIREILGLTTQLEGDDCLQRVCVRIRPIFGEMRYQRGGLLFSQFSTAFLMVFFLGLLYAQGQMFIKNNVGKTLLAALSFLVTFYTYSRTGYLGVVALISITAILTRSSVKKLGFLAVLVLFLAGVLIVTDPFKALDLGDTSAFIRVKTYVQIIPQILYEHPLGVGYTFVERFAGVADRNTVDITGGESFISALAVPMGLPGIILYFGILICLSMHVRRLTRTAPKKQARLGNTALAIFLTAHLMGLFLPAIFGREVNTMLWAIVALTVIYISPEQHHRTLTPSEYELASVPIR